MHSDLGIKTVMRVITGAAIGITVIIGMIPIAGRMMTAKRTSGAVGSDMITANIKAGISITAPKRIIRATTITAIDGHRVDGDEPERADAGWSLRACDC